MKKIVVLATAALIGFAAAAGAQDDPLKKYGCGKCHDMTKKKMGPPVKTIAADFKKAGLSGDKAYAKFKDAHDVDDMPLAKTEADRKAALNWMLAQ